jgi:hypothetical protein
MDLVSDFEQKKGCCQSAVMGACSGRLRKAEGSLLGRPAHRNIKRASS